MSDTHHLMDLVPRLLRGFCEARTLEASLHLGGRRYLTVYCIGILYAAGVRLACGSSHGRLWGQGKQPSCNWPDPGLEAVHAFLRQAAEVAKDRCVPL